MANRYTIIRKKLIKEAILLTVVVLVLSGGGFFLEMMAEDMHSEQQNKENEVTAARSKLTEMRKELEGSQTQVSMYTKYAVSHNPTLSLNREEMTKWLVEQREQFHLVNLSITIPPFTDVKDSFPVKSGILIKSDVKLSFGALTDNSVFALIAEMQRKSPGVVVIQDIKLSRTGDLNQTTLIDLTNHRITPLVTADISFAWYGIRPDTKAADASKGAPVVKGNANAP